MLADCLCGNIVIDLIIATPVLRFALPQFWLSMQMHQFCIALAHPSTACAAQPAEVSKCAQQSGQSNLLACLCGAGFEADSAPGVVLS
jgi:hypothetical protein